ncbi:MAG TPA: EamA family transporter [Acidimicrobiales bacterium]|nr:EamA family transporter [Acidimicrobiales bacterium]
MWWVPVTVAAATFQILRTSRQHLLRDALDLNAAGYVRYLFAFPVAATALVATAVAADGVPVPPLRFWPIITAAGLAQIGGTLALLHAFRLRDFAIGTVFAKSEVLQVVVVSAVVLGEPLTPAGVVGAVVVLVGVVVLAAPGQAGTVARRVGDPAAWAGAAAGAGFALAAVGIRAASGTLGDGPAWPRAVVTLTAMLAVQTLVNGVQLLVTDRPGLVAIGRVWRRALVVGVLSAAGSAGWALAVTLTNAAKVRTLGQVELLLAFAISLRWGERHRPIEYAASALVAVGIVTVTWFG